MPSKCKNNSFFIEKQHCRKKNKECNVIFTTTRYYVLLSVSAERKNQERPCCTLRVRQNAVLHTVLRDSLRSNKSSHRLTAPCSVTAFYTFLSRYRNIKSPSLTSPKGKKPHSGHRAGISSVSFPQEIPDQVRNEGQARNEDNNTTLMMENSCVSNIIKPPL